MFWKFANTLAIAAGLATWITTLIDMFHGFVILPSRYQANTIISIDKPSFFWGVAFVWFIVGGVFLFIGIYGLRTDKK
jgi:hypothetical protein